jgi:hypothetical protein
MNLSIGDSTVPISSGIMLAGCINASLLIPSPYQYEMYNIPIGIFIYLSIYPII